MPTQFTENGSLSIAYEDHGGHGGDPLLLIMGMSTSRFWWPPKLIELLIQAGFHVASYDHRDAGESDHWPTQPGKANPIATQFGDKQVAYSAEDVTGDGIAVLNALGWDGAHLFGHSMGGLVAQHIALAHPGSARTVTTSAAVPAAASKLALARYVRPTMLLKMSRVKFPKTPEGDAKAAVDFARILTAPAYPLDEEYANNAANRDRRNSFSDNQLQARQAGAKWTGPGPEALTVPLLSFHGDADPLLRVRAASDLTTAAPDARLVILPGVGHDLPRAMFTEYATELRRHVDRWSTASTRQ